MNTIRFFIALLTIVTTLWCFNSCKKDNESPDEKQEQRVQFSGNVNYAEYEEIDYNVNGNLIVDGSVVFRNTSIITSDLNLNEKGKIVIDTEEDTCHVKIKGNVNLNDTVLILHGVLVINGDLNVNSKGFIYCMNTSKVMVIHNLNQNGRVYGFKNILVFGNVNLNEGSITKDELVD